jgi:anti-sigma factor RsiW
MKCPDRAMLARLLDGEIVLSGEEIRAHISGCPLCREKGMEEGEMGTLLRAFFAKQGPQMIRESVPCPSPEEMALYAEGRIPVYRRRTLLQHFCACPACARAVLDIGGAKGEALSEPPAAVVREARGVYRAPRKK